MSKLNKKLNLDWRILVLIFLGLIFFAIYSFLALDTTKSWMGSPKIVQNSPDETSNLFFANIFRNEDRLYFVDEANLVADDLVSPRSMRVINNNTVPAGFLGLPIIYGSIAKITGAGSIPFFTPVLSIIGLIFFYYLIKEFFDKNIAFISALFAFVLPGWWYYSAKSMMPNIAFATFFIIAIYFFIRALKTKKLWLYVLFPAFLSLSLMVRTSELIWIGLLFISLILFSLKKINWSYLTIGLFIFLFCFLPIFHFNQQIYGSPFSVGYSLQSEFAGQDIFTQSVTLLEKIVLPFGFHPRAALNNLYDYTFKLFPVWTNFILFSLLFFIILLIMGHRSSTINKKDRKRWLLYLGLFILISGYLTIYYGSWKFHDHPDPNAITIGTSYIRYWLPIYLFSLPFLGFVFSYYFRRYKLITPVILILLFTVLSLTSFKIVMLDGQEGLYRVKENLNEYQIIAQQVNEAIEPNSIIVAGRMDKVFFPQKSVIFRLNVDHDYLRIKKLIEAGYPVYYFYFTRTNDKLNEFSKTNFEPFNLKVDKSILDFNKQSLYPINNLK